jgi:hypothetical protein
VVSDGALGRLVAAAALLLAGCGPGPPDPTPPAKAALGVYTFTATIPFRTGSLGLSGAFEITRDTVLLVLDDASCQAFEGSATTFSYRCAGAFADVDWVRVSFDREQPLERCGASAERRVPVEKEVCGKWAATKEGKAVCAIWNIEVTYRTERASGSLLVERRADPWR